LTAVAPGFGFEVFTAVGGEGVEAGSAVVSGESPVALDPAVEFEALEGRVERAFFNAEEVVREVLEDLGYGIAMERA
jgi:hypothetical protein